MSISIYYFSGSGNSFYIARELRERIPEIILIPMVSLLNNDVIKTTGDTIGFIFPVHCMTLPVPVKKFLSKLELNSEQYIFAVTTQGGAPPRLAEIHLKNVLKEKGVRLNAYYNIKMHWSSPIGLMPVFIPGLIEYPKTNEKISDIERNAQKKLDIIQKSVIDREDNPHDDFPCCAKFYLKHLISSLTSSATKALDEKEINFYADSGCTGCGICESICPSSKIQLEQGKPIWQKNVQCYFCYACFSFCPEQSILVDKIYTKKNGRYSHQRITASDIAQQKIIKSPALKA